MPLPSLQNLNSHPAVLAVMLAASKSGGEVRVVGGAVRDALLGRAVDEIDLATSLPPSLMVEALTRDGIKSVPTGIAFGTITAVIDGVGYEVTTLRRDVESDGRRARVAYTADWQADAARRDFTMNALYLDARGKLYDYFGGQEDAAAGRVRFIGDAKERIREDVLRILRFFRFYAWYGRGAIDANGYAACRALAELMPQLSPERVWREITKLLAAPNPAPTWRLMSDAKILDSILPEANHTARLEGLLKVEGKYEVPPASLRRFAALLPADEQIAESVAQILRTSKREAAKLHRLAGLPALLQGKFDPVPYRHILYEFGVEDTRDASLLYAAEHPETDLEQPLALAAAWDAPQFPLQGQDLLTLGMKAGPEVGAKLRALEEQWIASDFKLPRDALLEIVKSESQL